MKLINSVVIKNNIYQDCDVDSINIDLHKLNRLIITDHERTAIID
ncbi:MAG: hypothetical protein ACTS77_01100 [Arsenophonus sp. NC-TX2-MAG3]